MKTTLTVLITILCGALSFESCAEGPTFALARSKNCGWFENNELASNSDNRKSKDGFGAQLWIINDGWFFYNWNKPEPLDIPLTDVVMRNEESFFVIPFINPGLDDSLVADVVADLTIIGPNGEIYGEFKELKIWQGPYDAGLDETSLGEVPIQIVIEDGEPLGTYKVKAVVKDNIKNVTLKLQTEFVAKENLPPAGYTWHQIPEISAWILTPNGWHTSKPKSQERFIFQMSKEPPTDTAQTILSLSVHPWEDEHFPLVYEMDFFTDFMSRGERWIHGSRIEEGSDGWTRGGLLVEKEMTIGGITQQYTIQYFVISNPETHTLYKFTFRTPSKDWEENQKIWTTISNPKLRKNL